jgi:hypothetical protein
LIFFAIYGLLDRLLANWSGSTPRLLREGFCEPLARRLAKLVSQSLPEVFWKPSASLGLGYRGSVSRPSRSFFRKFSRAFVQNRSGSPRREVFQIGSGDVFGIGPGDVSQIGSGEVFQIGSGKAFQIGSGDVSEIGSGDVFQIGSGDVLEIGSGDVFETASGELALCSLERRRWRLFVGQNAI